MHRPHGGDCGASTAPTPAALRHGVTIARARRYRRMPPTQSTAQGRSTAGRVRSDALATKGLAWPPEWAPNRERHMTLTSPSGSCQSH